VRKWLIGSSSFSRTSYSAQTLACLGWRLSSGFPEYGKESLLNMFLNLWLKRLKQGLLMKCPRLLVKERGI